MVSTDQGTSIKFIGEVKISPANGEQGYPLHNHGVYNFAIPSASYPNDIFKDKGNSLSIPSFVFFNDVPLPVSQKKYYQMTGFYVTGSVYESFVIVNNPTSPTTVNPNTGHTLTNTFVSSYWIV